MIYKRISAQDVTPTIFKQMVDVEVNAGGDPCSIEELQATIMHTGNDNFVCIKDEKIVAFATVNKNSRRLGGSIYIVNLSVRADYQRKGIAKNLFKNISQYYFNQYSNKCFTLHVSKDNVKAIGLYKKLGFEIREDLVEDAEDLGMAVLVKDLFKQLNQEKNK